MLQEPNNTPPIEFLTTSKELGQDYLTETLKIVKSQNQKVYSVSLRPILNADFSSQKISGYYHKFCSVLLNTFEDAIFIDVDAVPFRDLEQNFENEECRRAEIYLNQGGAMPQRNKSMCLDIYYALKPTLQEKALIGTKLTFESRSIQGKSNSIEGLAFKDISRYCYYFHLDSDLITVNNRMKFGGLLMPTLQNYLPQLSTVSHGDKEFFSIGPIVRRWKIGISSTGWRY